MSVALTEIPKQLSKLWDDWCDFWFAPRDLYGLALMRIQLCGVMLYMYVIRHLQNLNEFTDAGLVPRARALGVIPEFIRPVFPFYELWSDAWGPTVHAVFLVLLFLVMVGAWSRVFAWIAWVIALGFIDRNYSILFGADVIATLFLFYLAFTRSDEVLSVKSWWRARRGQAVAPTLTNDVFSSVFYRFIQIHVSVIYAYTGLEKLKGSTWWDGTALWSVFGNPQMVTMDLTFLRHLPIVIAFMTFSTVMFEIYWPFAIIGRPWVRRLWLAAGVMMHAGIAIVMGLATFSLVMTSTYWLFIRPEVLRGLGGRILRRFRGQATV